MAGGTSLPPAGGWAFVALGAVMILIWYRASRREHREEMQRRVGRMMDAKERDELRRSHEERE